MSESLDGGAVTYRSNRHFDLLNENIIFSLKSAANESDYRTLFEARRTSYGQGLVLLNTTSHDEENYSDPFQALVRYSVAATIDGAPNTGDVVFAFANLNRDANQSNTFNVNITQNGANLFGIKSNRTYNVKNIAAYLGADANRRNVWLWGAGTTGTNLLANGIFVGLNKVPSLNSDWTNAPFEAQYLKLYDVTPPPTPATPGTNVSGTNVTFSWPAVVDTEGGISGYHVIVGTNSGGSNVFNGTVTVTNKTSGGSYGQTLYARVAAINNAGIEGAFSSVASATIPTPTNAVRVTLLSVNFPGPHTNLLTLSGAPDARYITQFSTNLASNSWVNIATNFAASNGVWTVSDVVATNSIGFYRVQFAP